MRPKNCENDNKSEADIKNNSNYSSISVSNTPYFSLQDPLDYFETSTEKNRNKSHIKAIIRGKQLSLCSRTLKTCKYTHKQ